MIINRQAEAYQEHLRILSIRDAIIGGMLSHEIGLPILQLRSYLRSEYHLTRLEIAKLLDIIMDSNYVEYDEWFGMLYLRPRFSPIDAPHSILPQDILLRYRS